MFTRARLHIKTAVPPGYSLVGAMPFNLFRLEQAKLTENPRLWLIDSGGQPISFDGAVHDIRSKWGGSTLCIGAHVALCIRNDGDGAEPLEVQISGTVADGMPIEPGSTVLPELGHSLVVGMHAQEAVLERFEPGRVSATDLLAIAAEHYARAQRKLALTFEKAVLSGSLEDWIAMRDAERERERFSEMVSTAQAMFAGEIPRAQAEGAGDDEFGDYSEADGTGPGNRLGLDAAQWESMKVALMARNGWSAEEFDQHIADMQDPEKRRAFHDKHVKGAGLTFSDE